MLATLKHVELQLSLLLHLRQVLHLPRRSPSTLDLQLPTTGMQGTLTRRPLEMTKRTPCWQRRQQLLCLWAAWSPASIWGTPLGMQRQLPPLAPLSVALLLSLQSLALLRPPR